MTIDEIRNSDEQKIIPQIHNVTNGFNIKIKGYSYTYRTDKLVQTEEQISLTKFPIPFWQDPAPFASYDSIVGLKVKFE
jgi:hypothetical protein